MADTQRRTKSKLSMAIANHLPYDIMVEILIRLPVNSLLRFQSINKVWCSLINSNNFVNKHLNHHHHHNASTIDQNNSNLSIIFGVRVSREKDYMLLDGWDQLLSIFHIGSVQKCLNYIVDDDEDMYPKYDDKFPNLAERIEIVGSCDGLLCINKFFVSPGIDDMFCLWNPSTREYKQLPAPPLADHDAYNISIQYGFGYDPIAGDYKLVMILFYTAWTHPLENEVSVKEKSNAQVMVYSLGTNSWTSRKRTFACYLGIPRTSGVLLNRALHWMAILDDGNNHKLYLIIAFDLGNEDFKQLTSLSLPNDKYGDDLCILGGRLCVVDHRWDGIGEVSQVWLMQDYGVKDSWTKICTITQESIRTRLSLRPLCFLNTGEIILDQNFKYLVLYNPKVELISKKAEVPGFPRWFQRRTHIGSLVRLGSSTYVGKDEQHQREEGS